MHPGPTGTDSPSLPAAPANGTPDAAAAVPLTYDRVAGRSLERIGALSDGVFAIAMTLIVLEIRVPDPAATLHTDAGLLAELANLAPRFVTYLLSFLTVGIFWNAQHTQLNHIARANRDLTWLQLVYLALVALLPFTTSLLAEFIDVRLAFAVYWLDLLLLGVLLYANWSYARRAGLIRDDTDPGLSRVLTRRIVVYQSLYFAGLVLALVAGTLVGIAFVVLIQINSAIGPRVPILSRF